MKRRAFLQSLIALAPLRQKVVAKKWPLKVHGTPFRVVRRIPFTSSGNIILDEKLYLRNIDAFRAHMKACTWVLPTRLYPVRQCSVSFVESSSS